MTARCDFAVSVRRAVQALDVGEVASYGEIAEEAGHPGAGRAVGRVLAEGDGAVPWWRVVTSTGRLVPGQERRQGALLVAEGVTVRDGRVHRRAGGR